MNYRRRCWRQRLPAWRITSLAGTVAGGKKAAAKNLANDPDFYRRIGKRGGQARVPKGFGTNPELARIAGIKGGKKSKRGPAVR